MNWKPVVGYAGEYEVSSCGQVRSIDRVVTRSNNSPLSLRGCILRQKTDNSNRKRVSLGRRYTALVHRLVAQAFIPNPDNKPCVNHKDFNPSNNHVSNLEWVTKSENSLHDLRHGKRMKKLNPSKVQDIRKRIADGDQFTAIGNDYGVTRVQIAHIAYGRQWTWLPTIAGID